MLPLAIHLLTLPAAAIASPADAVRGIPHGESWEGGVRRVMVGSYDADRSGILDHPPEIEAVGCDVWQAMDQAVRASWQGSSVRVIYGVDAGYVWVGDALGLDEAVRREVGQAMGRCGLPGQDAPGAYRPPAGVAVPDDPQGVASRMRAVPLAAPDTWGGRAAPVLAAAYDLDGDGKVSNILEIDAVPCEVWGAVGDRFGRDPIALEAVTPRMTAPGVPARRAQSALVACGATRSPAGPAGRIRAFAEGGTPEWDAGVRETLLGVYDRDRSGALDREDEVRGIDCPVWATLDRGVRQRYDRGLRQVYGFAGDLNWVGYTLGFGRDVKRTADAKAKSCGLTSLEDGTESRAPEIRSAAGPLSRKRKPVVDTTARPAVVEPTGPTPAARIGSVEGADGWEGLVRGELLAAYDHDRSGALDAVESSELPCVLFRILDRHVTNHTEGPSVRALYGFDKDHTWAGGRLGFDDGARRKVDRALAACGL